MREIRTSGSRRGRATALLDGPLSTLLSPAVQFLLIAMIEASLTRLLSYVEAENYNGYDPYDTLNSWVPFQWLGKWGPVLAIQFQKRNPLNIRPLLGIRKGRNPKAIGLFLRAYSTLYRHEPREEYLLAMHELFDWLKDNPSPGYSRYCWGYDFPWASPVKYMDAYMPSVVATGFVVKGIFEYWCAIQNIENVESRDGAQHAAPLQDHEQRHQPNARNDQIIEVLSGAADFVLNHLDRVEDETGVCISYTPVMKDACYNASLLGAEILARYLAVVGSTNSLEQLPPRYGRASQSSARPTRGDDVLNLVERSVDFVVARQLPDGRWNYSVDLSNGRERTQIDFHQGYVIESIEEIMRLTDMRKPRWEEAVRKGLEYYRKVQFFDEGRSLWRIPKEWPVEIHNQAQGVITFGKFDEYREFAGTIAEWTIEHMQDSRGYFYYQKFTRYTNKISYMRWSNAWMAVALSSLHEDTKNTKNTKPTKGL